MKTTSLNLQIVVNIGNYESLRLGAEWTPDKTEPNIAEEMQKADAVLREAAQKIIEQRHKEQKEAQSAAQQVTAKEKITEEGNAHQTAEKKQKLTIATPCFQKILKRIESGVKIETVLQYYEPDDEAMKVLKLAGKLN